MRKALRLPRAKLEVLSGSLRADFYPLLDRKCGAWGGARDLEIEANNSLGVFKMKKTFPLKSFGILILLLVLFTRSVLAAQGGLPFPKGPKLDIIVEGIEFLPAAIVQEGTTVTIRCKWSSTIDEKVTLSKPRGDGSIQLEGNPLPAVFLNFLPAGTFAPPLGPKGVFETSWPMDKPGTYKFTCGVSVPRIAIMNDIFDPLGNNTKQAQLTVTPKPTVPRLSANQPVGPVMKAPMTNLGNSLSGAVKSCQTSLSASVNVDSHQFANPSFGPADMAQTKIMLHLQKSEAAGNNINCYYATHGKDVPNLVVTVKCNNAAPYGGQPHSYGCMQ